MTVEPATPAYPHGSDAEMARDALKVLRRAVDSHTDPRQPVEMTVADGGHLEMPGPAAELMIRILGKMAAGQGVTVIPMNAELTTQQAADLLNVSRPYLVRLLESGQIEFRKVGTHRRVMAESLYDYKRRALVAQKDAADELSALGQEMGLI
ncbi:excisionase family DNA-binding protein [Paenarthrobacter ureafaciens]|jgi:excisionase family DNA binding protein|uniref:excisionase family DNA-binding protein n=1 Tax=Paenarthrobacter ureafaciens TaxID=37931 RepID=UPI0019178C0F|nr:excisionase family DNA-binding protein [Paenarthrobacter ureafaciens]QQQ61852.1 excisionase family DNA-binding protein [Paenarthrobacter ureafaciens]UOD80675.1 excisionase family DNA-binding protein [Paenarthrobacter ureafaciens]WNZ03331.1 excisionase family DNA-binding protein [Paenarthrobacter ureafaciens]